jgi:hypothetical protein
MRNFPYITMKRINLMEQFFKELREKHLDYQYMGSMLLHKPKNPRQK